MPIGQILTNLAAEDPGRPAVTCGGQTVSRQDLETRANRLARAYEALGLGQGDLVTVALPNSVEFYEVCFALWKLGATPQPVSWRLPGRELDEIIKLADPAAVIGRPHGPDDGRVVIPAGFTPDPALSDAPPPVRVSPSWKALTSGGSTGRPKLIVTQDNGVIDTIRRPLNMQPHQVQLIPGPLYHSTAFSSVFGLFIGQHLVVMERFDAAEALRLIEAHRVNFMQLVPTMMLRMLRYIETGQQADLSSVEALWHLGAPCPAWLKEKWIEILGPDRVLELYSCTETIAMTQISGREWLAHRGSVGRPVVGEMKVADADGQDLPPGTPGEIYMRRGAGAATAFEYVGSGHRMLPGGWESVGDMGWIDADGYIYVSDRRVDMILSGGANVYPAEVEAALLAHPQVVSCAVVGLPDDDLGQRVHAVIEPAEPIDEAELRGFLAQRLVRYKIPRTFRFIDRPLRDDAGKVRRSAVREHEIAAVSEGAA